MRERATRGTEPSGGGRWRPLLLGLAAALLAGIMLGRSCGTSRSNPRPAPGPVRALAPGVRGRTAERRQPENTERPAAGGIANLYATPFLARAAAFAPTSRVGVEPDAAAGRLQPLRRAARPKSEWPVFQALRASRGRPVDARVAALAGEITRDCRMDAERARALYDWITGHITYDWQEWAHIVSGAGTYQLPHDPLSVIERGTTVCAGYAWLYNDLARSIGLKSDFIIGDVRGYRGTPDDELISPYQHAWNGVNIDGVWYLLDATWGARQPGEAAADYQARSAYYFATPANQLIFDHLPETTEWQLLAAPVPADAFSTLPNLKPAFFRDGLLLGNHFSDTIAMPADGAASVTLLAPEGVEIAATLLSEKGKIGAGHLLVSGDGVRRDILLDGLPAGDYLLRVYSRSASSAGAYECCLDYAVEVR